MAQNEENTSNVCKTSLTEQENSLLKRWETSLHEKDESAQFIRDGIVNEERYKDGSHIRILYLLKETNRFNDYDYDLRKYIDGGVLDDKKKNPRHATWDNIVRWTYGIYNIDSI